MSSSTLEHAAYDDSDRLYVERDVYRQVDFDQVYGSEPAKSQSVQDLLKSETKSRLESFSCKDTVKKFFPILHWLPRYKVRQYLVEDIVAGLIVGIMHIPQGMAYSNLAGVPPIYGLYTSFFSSFIYVILGTSRHISLGPFSVVALMIGDVRFKFVSFENQFLPQNFLGKNDTNESDTDWVPTSAFIFLEDDTMLTAVDVVTSLTFMAGVFFLLMRLCRLGFLATFLSDQVVNGFTTGAAFMVMTAQIDKVFGIKIRRFSGPLKLYYTYKDVIFALPKANWFTFGILVVCMFVLFLVKETVNSRYKKKLRLPGPIPIDLIVIIIATLASHYGDFKHTYHVKTVGRIPTGIRATIPKFSLMSELAGSAFTLTIIIFSISISMAKIFAKRHNYAIDCNQELLAFGVVEVFLSFFTFGCSGALARSLVNEGAGARTQIASVIASGVVFVVLYWVGHLFKDLPVNVLGIWDCSGSHPAVVTMRDKVLQCVLSSIILTALKGLFMQFQQLPHLWRVSKMDFSIWMVTFLATFILDVTLGLAVGVLFAIITVIFRSQSAGTGAVGRISDTELFLKTDRYNTQDSGDLKIFRFDAPIFYGNGEAFRESLLEGCNIDIIKVRKEIKKAAKRAGLENAGTFKDSHGSHIDVSVSEDNFLEGDEDDEGKPDGASLQEALKPKISVPKAVIIDCTAIGYVDVMGVGSLKQTYEELAGVGIEVYFAGVTHRVHKMLSSNYFFDSVPHGSIFVSVIDAVLTVSKAKQTYPD